jgi:hypothetical protein
MHSRWLRSNGTAGGALRSLGLAVLFLVVPATFQLGVGASAWGIGLEIRLDEKGRHLVRYGNAYQTLGLSVSSDSLPLLDINLRHAQSVLVDYEDRFVTISEKLGYYQLYKPIFLTLPTYTSASNLIQFRQDWRNNLNRHFFSAAGGSRGLFEWEIPVKFPKVVSAIIGEGGPGLKVTGYRKISFSGRSTWEEGLKNTATSRQSKFPSLHMEQASSFQITGTIGSKISVQVDQDSRRQTDLQNTLRLRYKGDEDEIIQSIEMGNTNLSVGSGVVGISENKQGLFGIKTTAKIGGWNLTMITSQDKGSTQKADFKAGAETMAHPIRDYEYLHRTFYDLGDTSDLAPGDSVIEIRLFKSNTQIQSSQAQNPAPFGIAYIDPRDPSKSGNEGPYLRRFQEIDPSEYFSQNKLHYIQFFSPVGESDILAAWYVAWRAKTQSIDTTGVLKDSCTSAEQETCMVLQLLKSDDPKPSDYTWDYEWKNVYYLGNRNIQREGFRLDIYKGAPNAEDITQDPNYQDSTSYLRMFGLDDLDLNASPKPDGIVDYRQIDFGLGYLILPNRHPFAPDPNVSLTGNPADTLKDKVDQIYNWTSDREPAENSKYYIWVESASRKSTVLLGRAPIIEGSDVVTLNGAPLKRGEDYTIQYEIGEISFINPDALSPNADLSVSYEYAPLLMVEKKSMFGAMADYSLGDNLKFGAVGIYKSEKTADERPRVGQEPTRNFIWGSNLSFNSNPQFLTNLVNGIPWVYTDAPSNITFRGDLEQSVPNPNTKDQAFIDDFEGSLQYTDLSIRRGSWTLSSAPENRQLIDRCRLWWYNPYDQVLVSDIWPNKETERNEERTNILQLQFFPAEPERPSNAEFDSLAKERNWNGIQRALYPGAYDQTRTKFLELWVHGNQGILHIDLGEISEDLNGDRILNTEDKPRNGQRDGILDDDEDLGLDTLNNDQERTFWNCPTCEDASGDDWNYDNRYDYSHINGTQGNREDPDRGRRPDTEDINSNSVLDLTDKYFEFTVDLSQSKYLATENDKGWKLYRIPLADPANYVKVGEPDWTNIRFSRLWVTADDGCAIKIASLQLVGNRWQNQGVSSVTGRQTPIPVGTVPDEEFDVFVKNTHEDPEYYPPPGIAGTLNRQTNVREKEQSLVLKFDNLKLNHQGVIYRILSSTENYTNYRYLEMYVHGPEDGSLQSDIQFYFRLGTDSSNFYEYHSTIYPGWDERNKVSMDFDAITGLKAYAMEDSTKLVNGRLDVTEGPYRVKGSPALNRVRWFSMGVVNAGGQSASGEVWADELQVTGIRKLSGMAGSMDFTAKFADLATASFNFNMKESQFRSLDQKQENTNSTSSYRFSLSAVQIHRLLPVSLGYSLPFSYSYNRTLSLPKWKAGSDIVLPKDLRDREKQESISQSITFTPQFNFPTENWLVGATLRRMSHSINYSTSRSTSLLNPVQRSSSAVISGGYSFPLARGLNFKPFGWLKGALVPSSFTQLSFSLLPTSLSVNGSLSRTQGHTVDRVGKVFDTYTRTFTGNLSATASPVKAIPLTYNMRTGRDLQDPQTIIYSLNPKKAKLGIETNFGESFTAKYTPRWLSFLSADFGFESKYDENADKLDQYNVGGTRKVINNNDKRASFTLDWKKILGGTAAPKEEKKKASLLNPLNFLRAFTNRFDPVNISWRRSQTFSKSGLLARPAWAYRLGFSGNPRVERQGLAQSTDRETINQGYTARSGLLLLATHFDLNYARNVGQTITATDNTKTLSTRFPDVGFSLSQLGNLGMVKRFFTAFACNVAYFRQVDEQRNEKTGEKLSRKTSENFSPLASVSVTWKNGVRTSVKVDKKTTTDENLRIYAGNQSVTKTYDNSINVTNNYSFSAPGGIKIPFLRKLRFKSTLGLSLGVTMASGKTESSVGGKGFNVTADNNRLTVSTSASYNFSSQVTGGFQARWADTNDKKTRKKTHTREVGIWIQINF